MPDPTRVSWTYAGLPEARSVDAVLIGEALVAFLSTDGLPLARSTQYRRTVVGAEYNVATGLARLGHSVVFGGRVGEDVFGRVVEADGRTNGLLLRTVRDPQAPTGVLSRDVSATAPTTVQYARHDSAGTRLCVDDVVALPLEDARLLHVSGITCVLSPSAAAATEYAMVKTRAAGGCVSFDPNVRRRFMGEQAREVLVATISRSDVLLAGADELSWLAATDDMRRAMTWALDHGPGLVVVKDGAHGSTAGDGAHDVHVDAIPVAVVDPVGAGDAYAAGFLSGLLRGRTVEVSMHEATRVAALVVATHGDTEGLPGAELRNSFRGPTGEVAR